MERICFEDQDFIKLLTNELEVEYSTETSIARSSKIVECDVKIMKIIAKKDILVTAILGRMCYHDVILKSGDTLKLLDSIEQSNGVIIDGAIKQGTLINSGITLIDCVKTQLRIEYSVTGPG